MYISRVLENQCDGGSAYLFTDLSASLRADRFTNICHEQSEAYPANDRSIGFGGVIFRAIFFDEPFPIENSRV